MIAVLLLALAPQSETQPERSLAHDLYRAQIAAAESATRLGEAAVARAWLDETDPALRGFEWRVHDAAKDESSWGITVEQGHVYTLDVSPDGATLAVGLSTGGIELRRTSDGSSIATLAGYKESLAQLRFDSTGERLVSASFDRTVKVWDVARRELLVDFLEHKYPVGGAAFSPDGKLIASCSYERPGNDVVGTVHLWNAVDGTLVRTFQGGRKPLIGLAFSPDGRRFAAGSWDFCVFTWSVDGGEPVKCPVPDEGVYNAVDDVAWSPDSKFVVGGSKDKSARVWNADTGELVATLRAHTDFVGAVDFARDGETLATGSADGSICIWNTKDWSLKSKASGHAGPIEDLRFAPNSKTLYSGSRDKTLRAWDTTHDWYGGAKMRATAAVYVARFSPDDQLIASCSYDGRIQIWSAVTLDLLSAWQAHPSKSSCHALGWTSDGRRLVSGSWEPVVRVWDSRSGKEIAALEQPAGTYYLAVSPDGRLLATACGKQVIVWNLNTFTRQSVFEGHSQGVTAVNFSPDSRWCASTGRDGKALVWDAATGELRCSITAGGQNTAEAVFTTDARELAVAGRNGVVTLHDAEDGTLLRTLARSRHGITHLDLSPDGTRVAIATDIVELIDSRHGRIVGSLRPHFTGTYNVDFDSTGERLASCATDETICVSEVRPLRERLALRSHALAARARAQAQVETEIAGGRSAVELLTEFDDRSVSAEVPEVRRARLEALILALANQRP
ncbi:MAG: WD40 repeat domain-containing protein [Planctomycetes bacterium]|nr:WD40 repeat domain-containing protein [Planctomycetota bacterium]